jgi:hypothetical protein
MKQHKAYQLTLEKRTVWVKATGIVTVRSAGDYQRDLKQLVQPLLGSPWALVMDVRSWQPSPLAVIDILKEVSLWCFANQLKFVVVLQPDDALLAWQYLKATDVTKPADLIRHLVADDQQARQVLSAADFLQP